MAAAASAPAITPALVREHGLTEEEYQRILKALGRAPTLTELGIFSVMWSEHCSYKSSRVHLRRLPTRGPQVVQGPGENAGIIDIGEGWVCAFKIESHNHPSFIEPFQGAATGVGGILRDIFTMGARPLAVMDSLRFGPIARPRLQAAARGQEQDSAGSRQSAIPNPPSPLAANRALIHKNHSLLEGVVSGIASYANCFGVPNLGGETKFEPCYSSNPLVNAFALGLARRDQIFYARAAGVGNPVIYVGAKTGRDGIHGATMASEEFTDEAQQKRPNVQVGDPFLEKLLLEGCLEAMRSGAVVAIQDMGAAGLTCSTCEMGSRGGLGLEIELERVPQRETGMSPYEIMLSESQERMLLIAERGREAEIFRIFEKWGLDAVEIGRVIPQATMRVLQHGQVVAEIPNRALTEEAPLYQRPLAPWRAPVPAERPASPARTPASAARRDCAAALKALLAAPNISSKRSIYQQYEHMVQTNTVCSPGAGDAGLIRIKGSERALAMALDGNGRWCYLDPELGAMHAVAEAARNVAVAGATPVAATNCLNFGNPERPEIMDQFARVIAGMAAACRALSIPITGGNVSFYNETLGQAIYPTPVVGVVGILEKLECAVTPDFKRAGHDILLLRATPASAGAAAEREFGSSEYAKEILGLLWGTPPALDLEKEAALLKCLAALAAAHLMQSAHDCSEGGVAVTLAECCFRHGLGARVELESALPPELVLFAEHPGEVLISCDPANTRRIQQTGLEYGLKPSLIGQTAAANLEIWNQGQLQARARVSELREVWEQALPRMLGAEE